MMDLSDRPTTGLVTIDGDEVLYKIEEGVTGPGIYRISLIDREGYDPLVVGEKEWNLINIKFGHEDAVIHFVEKILKGTTRS